MNFNIIDIVIVFFLLSGAILGFKRGAIQSLAVFVGTIVVIVLAYILKNPISELLYTYLPFFKLGGVFKGISVINILIYEAIAFFLVLSILSVILGIILKFTGLISKLINYSIILTLPSKLIGLIIGFLESYLFLFVLIFIIVQLGVTDDLVKDSKLVDLIITKTPFTDELEKSYEAINKIKKLSENIKTDEQKKNYESLDTLLEYEIISVDSAEKLVNDKKLNIKNANELIESYKVKK